MCKQDYGDKGYGGNVLYQEHGLVNMEQHTGYS